MRPEPGSIVFDRYRLEERIGRGGSGTVWRATDQLLHQNVALKRIAFGDLDDQQARLTRERTLREARLAALLRGHPHVISIYDVRVGEDDLWLVLEYLPARSLRELLAARGRLEPGAAAAIGAAVADALAAAHDRGITHRDVKPGNVLLGGDGVVKLTDFGISHLAGDTQITETGAVSGTVAFMAPETARTGETSPGSDVYSLGSTVYAAVEGTPPFGTAEVGSNSNQTRLLHVVSNGIITPPTPDGPLTPMLLRLLQVNPSTRPDAGTARDLLARLARGAVDTPGPPTGPTVAARRPGTGGGPGGAGTGGLTGGGFSTGDSFGDDTTGGDTTTGRAAAGRTATRTGRRGVLVAAAVLVLALLGAVGVVLGIGRTVEGRAAAEPFTGSPPLPESVDAVALTGPADELDLCPLLDPAWLAQYGEVDIDTGYRLEGCEARIGTDAGAAFVNVSVDDYQRDLADIEGDPTDLGGLAVVRRDREEDSCARVLRLSDGTNLYLSGMVPNGGGSDPCRLAETATATAVRALATGLSYRPGRTAQYSIASVDACAVIGLPTLATVPGLVPGTTPGFGDWSCYHGADEGGATQVGVELRLYDDDPADFGDPLEVGGADAYIETADGDPEDGDSGRSECTVIVVHRAGTEASPSELFAVSVDAQGTSDVVCAQAIALAGAGVPNLPAP